MVRDCALWRQLAGICCARVFCAHVRRNGSASSMCAHVSLRAHCRLVYASYASSASLQTWNPIRWILIAWQALAALFDYIYIYNISIITITLWCRILQFGGSLLGSSARVFLARMCARSFQAWYTMAFDCFASFVSIISQYSFVVQVCAF